MKVHSRLRTPSARFSSLINLMTRNRRKKALEIRALSSGSCGPAAPEVSLGAAAQRGQGQAGWEGRCVSRAGEGAALLLEPYCHHPHSGLEVHECQAHGVIPGNPRGDLPHLTSPPAAVEPLENSTAVLCPLP